MLTAAVSNLAKVDTPPEHVLQTISAHAAATAMHTSHVGQPDTIAMLLFATV